MRLSVVSPYPPGLSGVGQYGARIVAGLAAGGHFSDITVLANQHAAAPRMEATGRVRVQRIWALDRPDTSARLLVALRRAQPDVVWFNLGLGVFGRTRWANFLGLAAPLLARQIGIPTVSTLHEIFEASRLIELGSPNGRLTNWGGRAATSMVLASDRVCLTMQQYVRQLRADYGAQNLVHIPHGTFDEPEYIAQPAKPHILMFGSFAPYKGLPILLAAFRHFQARQTELQLTIAGSDHPRFPGYLASIRAEHADQQGVNWHTNVSENEVAELFKAASIVAIPSTATTGSSSVLHRAATYGRPVVASDLPDLRAAASEAGLEVKFAQAGDVEALASCLDELSRDPQKAIQIGQRNVGAMRSMTLADTCRRYARLFAEIQAASRPVLAPSTVPNSTPDPDTAPPRDGAGVTGDASSRLGRLRGG